MTIEVVAQEVIAGTTRSHVEAARVLAEYVLGIGRTSAETCPDCDQPMLPTGQVKRPNEYDHASGCPRSPEGGPSWLKTCAHGVSYAAYCMTCLRGWDPRDFEKLRSGADPIVAEIGTRDPEWRGSAEASLEPDLMFLASHDSKEREKVMAVIRRMADAEQDVERLRSTLGEILFITRQSYHSGEMRDDIRRIIEERGVMMEISSAERKT